MRSITGPASAPSALGVTEFFGTGLDGKLYRNAVDRTGRLSGWISGFAAGAPEVTWSMHSVAGVSGTNELSTRTR